MYNSSHDNNNAKRRFFPPIRLLSVLLLLSLWLFSILSFNRLLKHFVYHFFYFVRTQHIRVVGQIFKIAFVSNVLLPSFWIGVILGYIILCYIHEHRYCTIASIIEPRLHHVFKCVFLTLFYTITSYTTYQYIIMLW